jgi:CBS domain-containing protein
MIESPFSITPNVVLELLKKTRPFSDLDFGVLERLASLWVVDFFPRGTIIVEKGAREPGHFYFVQKGAIKRYEPLNGHEVLVDISGEGYAFDAASIIRRQKPDFTVEAIEDTFCFLLQRQDFLNLVNSCPEVAHYYLDTFSNEIIRVAHHELRSEKIRARKQESFFLFNQRLQNLILSFPETISSARTIKDAASHMAITDSNCLLIKDPSQSIVGIITDKDIRSKVVALGVAPSASVRVAMTTPVPTISSNRTGFDSLLRLVTEDVEHLAVEDRGEIIGILSAGEILAAQGASPLFLFRQASNQRDLEGLREISRKIPLVARNLIEGGAKASDVGSMISCLKDRVLHRLLELT